jgi:putative tryptophan/tyrosine transport system substrate-binding protein
MILDLRSFGQAQDRFWILDCRGKTQSAWTDVDLFSCSPNRKSKIHNRKWLGLSGIAFVLVVTGAVATAQEPAKVEPAKIPKVGWLSARGGSNIGQETIVRMLRDLGYVEGKSVAFEYRFADNKLERLPALADELVRLKLDVLLTAGTPGALALKKATRTIPIVFLDVTDPVAAGLVDSLARPGGNITGFSSIEAVLAGKRLELLKETVSKLSRVAVLWDPRNPGSTQEWKESQLAARELGLQLHSMEVSSADKYEDAFKEAIRARSGALAALSNPLASSNQEQIAELAARNRLPAVYVQGSFVTSGGLMSYGPDRTERYRRAAVFVDKILKGTKPADLPVEQPTKFEFMINLKAAKQIGLTIPPNVLGRADRVVR